MVGNLQSAAFRCYFEALVVVGVAAAAILYAILIIEVVHHFMQQRCYYFLNGACKNSCSYVDFVAVSYCGNPCIIF